MRVLSMGVYPIQKVNSQVVGQDDVSKLILNGVHLPNLKKKTTTTTNPTSLLVLELSIYFFVVIFRVLVDSITTMNTHHRT